MSIPDTVTELLEPIVATLDVELLDVEWNGNSLRITVDRLRAPGEVYDKKDGITTDQLQAVNRLISPILDQHDPIPGRYTLEVSSPGVERKLTKSDHYARAVGEEVVVKLLPGEEPRRVRGALTAFADDAVTVEAIEIDGIDQVDPQTHVIALDRIQKARTSFQWGPAPKPGGPKKKSGGSKGSSASNAGSAPAAKQQHPTTESKTEYEEES